MLGHQFFPGTLSSDDLMLKCAIVHTLSLSNQVIKFTKAVKFCALFERKSRKTSLFTELVALYLFKNSK